MHVFVRQILKAVRKRGDNEHAARASVSAPVKIHSLARRACITRAEIVILGPLLVAALLISCSRVSAQESSTDGVEFFEKNIRPLLVRRCYSCHSKKAGKAEGGLVLDSKVGWQRGGERGAAVVPRDVDASLLVSAVRYADADLQMPPDNRLTETEVAVLERWVAMGAPDPRTEEPTTSTNSFVPSDPVAGRRHWAFRPLTAAQVPEIQGDSWSRTDIDAFVVEKLTANSLSPSPDADRRSLVRRLYFQLIGLPPSPKQVSDFLNDSRPDAVARLVDQLLESPQFGVRWGRHWLDLARYADSNGLDENFLFREAWRYRNWVIEAVNADMPFDRFLLEQIAGDILPFDSIEQRDRQRIASGFLVIGPKVLLGNSPDERIMDVADEQMDTIGKAVLGQTLGCARCHDHKFDPIPTADYYALAGIFTSTRVMETRYMLGQQRNMERLIGLGADGAKLDNEYETYWRESKQRQERLKQGKQALELLQKNDAAAFTEFLKKHAGVVAESSKDTTVAIEERVKAQQQRVAELEAAAKAPPIPPRAMIAEESDKPANEHIRLAGQFDERRDEVSRGFLTVFGAPDEDIPDGQSGRLQLARWLTDENSGAGRLAARVMANRIWKHLIGRGIVRTVDNFGRTGEPPTHPELLDYLARRFIDSGWSTKSLVREIALSRTFAMASTHDDASDTADPENRWLWRAHRRRLEPEAFRDAMMSIAGTLDLTPVDSTVSYLGDQATAVGKNENRRRTDFPCRSVYLPVIRNDLPEVFDAFDFADPHATTGLRPQTMVATQGLFTLNDESVMQAAEETAKKLLADNHQLSNEDIVARLYKLVLNSVPDQGERNDVLAFVSTIMGSSEAADEKDRAHQAWTMACHALFASSRFQILE